MLAVWCAYSSEDTVLHSIRPSLVDQPHLLDAIRQEAVEPGHRTLQRGRHHVFVSRPVHSYCLFSQVMKFNVGEQTFQEAFDRTGRIINITVAPLNNYGGFRRDHCGLALLVHRDSSVYIYVCACVCVCVCVCVCAYRSASAAELPHRAACLYLECGGRLLCSARFVSNSLFWRDVNRAETSPHLVCLFRNVRLS